MRSITRVTLALIALGAVISQAAAQTAAITPQRIAEISANVRRCGATSPIGSRVGNALGIAPGGQTYQSFQSSIDEAPGIELYWAINQQPHPLVLAMRRNVGVDPVEVDLWTFDAEGALVSAIRIRNRQLVPWPLEEARPGFQVTMRLWAAASLPGCSSPR